MATLRRGRAKRLVLDIGSSSIRLCELSQTKAGYQLTKYYQRDLNPDPAVDEETKRKERVNVLKALLKEAKVRTRKTILSVPGRSVFTRARTLPPVPEHKVSQIVGYEIRQQIPFPLEQIALDYQILNRTESGSYDVMMAAIKVDVVDKHLEVLRETKCSIGVVDVSPFATYNWLKHTGEFGTDGECVAMLDLGATATEIVIERGNQFRFTRPLNLGGNDITKALAAALNVGFVEAEKFKRERAFAPTGDPARDGKMGDVLNPILTRMVGEISRSFGYFRSLPGGGTVDRVIVTGGGACLRNIIPFLQRQLGVEVRIARPLAGLTIAANAQQANEHPEQACVALGMALRCCEKATLEINLIPPRILEAARRKEQALYWVFSFITMAMIAASIIPARDQKDKQVVERIKSLKSIISMYDPLVAENPDNKSDFESQLQAVNKEVEQFQSKLTALKNSYEKAEFYLDELKLINDLRPEGGKVWFSSIETTVISKVDSRSQSTRRDTGAFGGGVNKADSLGILSTGFPGIAGGATEARVGGGFGGDRRPSQKKAADVKPLDVPNGFRVMGYAKDPDSLMEFVDRLEKYEGTSPDIVKVWFSEANTELVPITEMDQARVGEQGIVRSSGGGLGSGDGGGFSGGLGGGGAAARRPASASALNPYVETVVFFKLDIQFLPFAQNQNQNPQAKAAMRGFSRRDDDDDASDKAQGKAKSPFSSARDE